MNKVMLRAIRGLIMVGLVYFCSSAAAEGPVKTGNGLMLTWQEIPEGALKRLETSLSPQADPSAQVSDRLRLSDPAFIDPFRWQLTPARVNAIRSEQCAEKGRDFTDQLDLTVKALDFLDYDKAETLLKQARDRFICDQKPLGRETIGRYYFLSGVLQLQKTGQDHGLFARALWMAPHFPEPVEYPKEVRQAFADAAGQLPLRDQAVVRLELQDLEGLRLQVNGVVPADNRLKLPVGDNFLQLIDPNGQAVAGRIVRLGPEARAGRTVWPPDELRPPEAIVVQGDLLQAIKRGRLNPEFYTVLLELMARDNRPWTALLTADSASPMVKSIVLKEDGSLDTEPLSAESEKVSYSKGLLVTSLALGGATVLSGASYGTLYYIANVREARPTPETWDTYFTLGKVTGGATALCLTGALITGGLYFLRSGRETAASSGSSHLRLRIAASGWSKSGRGCDDSMLNEASLDSVEAHSSRCSDMHNKTLTLNLGGRW